VSLDHEQLEAAIRRNDATGVRDLLRTATEADRRAAARALRDLLRGPKFELPEPIMVSSPDQLLRLIMCQQHDHHHPSPREREWEEWREVAGGAAFLAARLGLAGGVAQAVKMADDHESHQELPEAEFDAVAGVLADRRPDWLADFVGRRLTAEWSFGIDCWLLARRLVRLGAIGRPDVPQYAVKMPMSLWHVSWHHQTESLRLDMTPAQALLADPELLEDEVWRLFTVPDVGRELERMDRDRVLTSDGVEMTGVWADSLAGLSEQGHLDRGRLLDATLDAFSRDFAPNRVAWYAAFHDRLAPTLDEMAARAGRYLGLLAVGAKPGVSLGQRACGTLLDAGRLAPAEFLAASGPALLFPQKSVATAQLKLLARVASRQPEFRARALATAAQAFGHQREDVQEAAVKLLARHGLPGGPEQAEILAQSAALSPVLAPAAAALGLAAPTAVSCPVPEVTAQPDPAPGDRMPPVEDPGELVELLTQLMEDWSDAVAVERALAGAVRLATLPADQRARLAAPLLKRAEQRAGEEWSGPFSGVRPASDLARLVQAWGTGLVPRVDRSDRPHDDWGSGSRQTVDRSGTASAVAGILTARIWEAVHLIGQGRPVSLLAEPASVRGAVDPDHLLGRLAAWAGAPAAALPRHDLEVALLRLPPGLDHSFWSAWARAHPTSARAARRAYQARLDRLSFESVVGEPAGGPYYHRAAHMHVLARLTAPAGDTASSHCWSLLTALDQPRHDHHPLYCAWRSYDPRADSVVTAWPMLCPWQPDLAAAHLLGPLSEGLLPGRSPATAAVESLGRPGHALGPVGHLALLTALASAEPDTRVAAAGTWIHAAGDGRIDPQQAGAALVTGVAGGAFKLSRVAEALGHAALDPVAGRRIVETTFAAAAQLIPARPANLQHLLELAGRISAATGQPPPPAALTELARQPGNSRLVTAARRLAG
jgi:hypothetical protein